MEKKYHALVEDRKAEALAKRLRPIIKIREPQRDALERLYNGIDINNK